MKKIGYTSTCGCGFVSDERSSRLRFVLDKIWHDAVAHSRFDRTALRIPKPE